MVLWLLMLAISALDIFEIDEVCDYLGIIDVELMLTFSSSVVIWGNVKGSRVLLLGVYSFVAVSFLECLLFPFPPFFLV